MSVKQYASVYQIDPRMLEMPGYVAQAEAQARYRIGQKLIEELMNDTIYTVEIRREERFVASMFGTRYPATEVRHSVLIGQAQVHRISVAKPERYEDMGFVELGKTAAQEFWGRVKGAMRKATECE